MISSKKLPTITGFNLTILAIVILALALFLRFLFLGNESAQEIVRKEGDVPRLSENDYYKWKSDSPYTIVNYFSLDCPYCLELDKIENENYTHYKSAFSLIYRHSPLTDIQPLSGGKAVISECVRRDSGTEKMFLFITDVYENYRDGKVDNLWVEEIAKKYLVDQKKLAECVQSKEVRDFIIKKRKEALSYNINGTPTLVVFKDGVQVARFDRPSASASKKILDALVKVEKKDKQ
jgi:protein-disulfide isomerase